MAAPFVVACTHCASKLKLKDSSFAGKKIRCPKCQEVFVVPGGGKSGAAKKAKKPGEEFDFGNISEDDYEPPPSEDGEESDFGDLPQSPVAKRKAMAKSGGKKKKKRASSGPGFGKIALVGAFVLLGIGLVGGIGYGIYAIVQGMGGGVNRLAWLPDDTEMVIEVHVADAWNSGVIRPLRDGEVGKALGEKMKGESPLDPNDIDRVVVGAAMNSQTPVVVVYANKTIDQADATKGATPSEYGGYQLYARAGSGTAFFPDARTMVTGPDAKLKAAIDRKGVCPVADQFAHMPTRGEVVFAAGKIPSPNGQAPAMFATSGLDPSQLSSLSASISLSSDIGIEFNCECPDTATAEKVVQAVEKDKADGLAQLQTQKSQMASNPMLAMTGMGGLLSGAEAALESYSVSSSGTSVTGSMTVPGKLIKDATEAMGPMMSMMLQQLPGPGSSGGFSPPPGAINTGGSENPPGVDVFPASEHGEAP